MLVLMPGNVSRKEILFIKDRNPEREHWTGRLLSRDEAIARSGIQTVLSTSAVRAVPRRDADRKAIRQRRGRGRKRPAFSKRWPRLAVASLFHSTPAA